MSAAQRRADIADAAKISKRSVDSLDAVALVDLMRSDAFFYVAPRIKAHASRRLIALNQP